MKVLLTGSAGFIGSAVDDALTARGDEVVRVDWMLPNAHGAGAALPRRLQSRRSPSSTYRSILLLEYYRLRLLRYSLLLPFDEMFQVRF